KKEIFLDEEVLEIIESIENDPRKRQVIISRLGADGNKPKTLEEIGQSMNISRERVRQIEARIVAKFKAASPIWTPVLDKVIRLISESPITSERNLEKNLLDVHFITTYFSIDSINKI